MRTVRLSTEDETEQLEELIRRSARTILTEHYSLDQIEAALGPVFGVDRQLILDGTYFTVLEAERIVGCGGWSKRASKYGGDKARKSVDPLLDPDHDAARIRAFFVDPDHVRKGIGRALMAACEGAIEEAGFTNVEIVATLSGERLYHQFGYAVIERMDLDLSNGMLMPAVRMAKELGR